MQVISSARPNPDRGRQAGAFAVRHVRRHRDDDAALGQVAADFRETAAFMRGSGEALVRSIGITPPLQALDRSCSEIGSIRKYSSWIWCRDQVVEHVARVTPLVRFGDAWAIDP